MDAIARLSAARAAERAERAALEGEYHGLTSWGAPVAFELWQPGMGAYNCRCDICGAPVSFGCTYLAPSDRHAQWLCDKHARQYATATTRA